MEIEFYTTLGCHLCEEALSMIKSLNQNDPGIHINEIEISESEELMAKYGIRIPVIAIDKEEIGWPFSMDELKAFLKNPR